MWLICLAHNFAQMCCFMLYLLDVCQIDGNTTFKNEFRNWTKGMARQALPRLHWQGLLATKQAWTPSTTGVLRRVGEVSGAETEVAERNGPETGAADYLERSVWWNNSQICSELLHSLPLMTCVKAEGRHLNIRLINLFSAYRCSLTSWAHATFQRLFLSVTNVWEVRYHKPLISENWTLMLNHSAKY